VTIENENAQKVPELNCCDQLSYFEQPIILTNGYQINLL